MIASVFHINWVIYFTGILLEIYININCLKQFIEKTQPKPFIGVLRCCGNLGFTS